MHVFMSALRQTDLSQYMSYLFERRDAQIDFFIHLWVKQAHSLNLYLSSSPSPPPLSPSTLFLSNKLRHFIDTVPDRPRDIVFDSPCYVLITDSPAYLHVLDTYR